jgi:magnesium-transporting ATPase (P-type)
LCNNARLIPPDEESARWTVLGDPTEAALLVVAGKAGIELRGKESSLPRVRELPFDSNRKRMSTRSTNARPHKSRVRQGFAERGAGALHVVPQQRDQRPMDQAVRDSVMPRTTITPKRLKGAGRGHAGF